MSRRAFALIALLAGCAPQLMSPERAADICEEQARATSGPTGSVTVGINSLSGPEIGGSIGVTSDFVQGRNPMEVYETCVFERTGQNPIRPPDLR